ncbi:MAG: helix-turn-helix domain-containing protein [Lachnospiraceae bacterium]
MLGAASSWNGKSTQCTINGCWTSQDQFLAVQEIQDILGISQPTAYALIKKNLFHSIRIGRNIRVFIITYTVEILRT